MIGSQPKNVVYGREQLIDDCLAVRKMAYSALLDFALAFAPMRLPPYVLLHIFEQMLVNDHGTVAWPGMAQLRAASEVLAAPTGAMMNSSMRRYFHISVEDRNHYQNVQLFINVLKSYRRLKDE